MQDDPCLPIANLRTNQIHSKHFYPMYRHFSRVTAMRLSVRPQSAMCYSTYSDSAFRSQDGGKSLTLTSMPSPLPTSSSFVFLSSRFSLDDLHILAVRSCLHNRLQGYDFDIAELKSKYHDSSPTPVSFEFCIAACCSSFARFEIHDAAHTRSNV